MPLTLSAEQLSNIVSKLFSLAPPRSARVPVISDTPGTTLETLFASRLLKTGWGSVVGLPIWARGQVIDWQTGYMSLACWIVVYSPQIWENYQLKSGEGLSVTFIVLWLLGDITNAVGGAMAKLLPTVVILALYVSRAVFFLSFVKITSLTTTSTRRATSSSSFRSTIIDT
jgi:hypothetical protein